MKKSESSLTENFLNLYDADGNPTDILMKLRELYIDETRKPYNLFTNISLDSVPTGLSSVGVWRLAHGIGRAKRISKEHYDFLKNQFFPRSDERLGHAAVMPVIKDEVEACKNHVVTIPISTPFKFRILRNIKLSRKSLDFYFEEKDSVPNGLTPQNLLDLLNGQENVIRKDYYDFLKNNWWNPNEYKGTFKGEFGIPNNHVVTIPISTPFKFRILRNMELCGKSLDFYFEKKDAVPDGLTPQNLLDLLNGQEKVIRKDYYDFLKKNWWSSPEHKDPFKKNIQVPVTVGYKSRISTNIEKSGKSIEEFFLDKEFVPEGLTPEFLTSWLVSDSLEIKYDFNEFIRKNWWSAVSRKQSGGQRGIEVIILLEDFVEELKRQFERTGVGVKKALKYADEVPKGLTPRIVDSWLNNKKRNYPTAKKIYADFVLELYKNFPDKLKK